MGLGFDVTVYRQAEGRMEPGTRDSSRGGCLASWRTGWTGLGWLDELAARGEAVELTSNGYPTTFTARAASVALALQAGPPASRPGWSIPPHDSLTALGEDRTSAAVSPDGLDPDEWLLIDAWDES